MAQAQFATVGPLATASATNIRTASAIAGAGAVTLNGTLVSGGVATLDKARQIIFTSSGNDTGITFTITGTDWSGSPIGEVVTGANAAAAATVLNYKTLTSVVSSGAAAGTVAIGTNGVAASNWVQFDRYAVDGVAVQLNVTGTVSYTLQQTLDDPNSSVNPVLPQNVVWVPSADTNVVNAIATMQTNYLFPPVWARVLLNSGTGSVAATFVQGG